ncbi:MAG: DUF655 domain-containing protein [Kastovskya adunca ATA6-11-RM4]|jgi:competence ComEA-like helix-hairpin-helix protein|nr:DUF655 domain-containing protein [Kastovskya adunca ATA6-11-RM4]
MCHRTATAGVPQLPQGDLLHHKFGVVDASTVVTGSHNWSQAANNLNDETLLIIQSATVAAHFEREFGRLYARAVLGVPVKVQQKIQAQQQECPAVESRPSSPSNAPAVGQLVNLNTASQEELETLPGVGPKLAQEIIRARQQQPFGSVEDFDRVPGVGPTLLEKLEGRISW